MEGDSHKQKIADFEASSVTIGCEYEHYMEYV